MSLSAGGRLLDLFCCEGGAAEGYRRAGWYVVGVDIAGQPRYRGHEFHKADALTFPLEGFDAIHASPPCQAYSRGANVRRVPHPDLIAPIRARLVAWGGPYVIENVELSPLKAQVMLCGTMFGLLCRRHRYFESNVALAPAPADCYCRGRSVTGELLNFHNTAQRQAFLRRYGIARQVDAMRVAYGTPWATDHGCKEAVPPPYTEWIGRQILALAEAA